MLNLTKDYAESRWELGGVGGGMVALWGKQLLPMGAGQHGMSQKTKEGKSKHII